MSEFRAYIDNLGKYNEGTPMGAWLDFPVGEEEARKFTQSIGITDSFSAMATAEKIEDFLTDMPAYGYPVFGWDNREAAIEAIADRLVSQDTAWLKNTLNEFTTGDDISAEDKARCNALLLEVAGYEAARYEEMAIHDFESDYDFRVSPYSSISDLNLLALQLEDMDEQEKSIALGYCKENNISEPLEIANVCMQADEFSYLIVDNNGMTNRQEALGYAIVEELNPALKETLENTKIGDGLTAYEYFDFEKYGRDVEIGDGHFIDDETFMFYGGDPDTSLYSRDELMERAANSGNDKAWTFRKVEEQLEGNYNQIDGIINNSPKEPTGKEDKEPPSRLAEIRAMGNEARQEPREARERQTDRDEHER